MADWSNSGQHYQGGTGPVPMPSGPVPMPSGPVPMPSGPVPMPGGTGPVPMPSGTGPVGWPGTGPVTMPTGTGPAGYPPYGAATTGEWQLPGQPQPKSRKPLIVTLLAGAAVIVVTAIVLAVALGGHTSDPGGGTAGDAVKGYLEALSRGDAEAALAYSDDQPASKEFLTNDILKKQIAKAPITNIRILGDDSAKGKTYGSAQVHVAANFGEKVVDANLAIEQADGNWRLRSAAVKLNPGGEITDNKAAKTITVFGKPVAGQTIYVFPGWVDFGSSNPYLSVKTKEPGLEDLGGYSSSYFHAEYEINEAGAKAVRDVLAKDFAACQKSDRLAPPDPCPAALKNPDLVDGTVQWGQPDFSGVKLEFFIPSDLTVRASGDVVAPIVAQDRSGGTRHGQVTWNLFGEVDLSKTPPTLTWR